MFINDNLTILKLFFFDTSMYAVIYIHVRLILIFLFQTKLGNVVFHPSEAQEETEGNEGKEERNYRIKWLHCFGETEKFFSNISNC